MKTKTIIAAILALFFSFTHAFSQAPIRQWDVDFCGSENEQFVAAQQTSEGGYIFGGYSELGISSDKTQDSRGSSDYWMGEASEVTFNRESLSDGIYFLQVKTNQGTAITKVILIH